jgi:hypothetical protein
LLWSRRGKTHKEELVLYCNRGIPEHGEFLEMIVQAAVDNQAPEDTVEAILPPLVGVYWTLRGEHADYPRTERDMVDAYTAAYQSAYHGRNFEPSEVVDAYDSCPHILYLLQEAGPVPYQLIREMGKTYGERDRAAFRAYLKWEAYQGG